MVWFSFFVLISIETAILFDFIGHPRVQGGCLFLQGARLCLAIPAGSAPPKGIVLGTSSGAASSN